MPSFLRVPLSGFACAGPLVALEQGGEVFTVDLAERGSPPWSEAAALVRDCFIRHYGAAAEVSTPFLLTLRNGEGEPLATMGIRPALGHRLFLENYLDEPIESFVTLGAVSPGLSPVPAGRRDIVEVGHLAALRRGAGRPLFVAAALLFREWSFRWVALTGTREVRSVFRRLGIAAEPIAAADPDRVPGGERVWGTYYSHAPKVMVANVDASDRMLDEKGVYRMLNLHMVRQEGRHEVA